MAVPQIEFAGLVVSRLMVGGNPFSGNSHQPGSASREMRDYFTTARIIEVLARCESLGITTFVGRADAHIIRVLHEYWNAGGRVAWIAQTAPEMRSVDENIRRAVGEGARAVYIHGGWFDERWEAGDLADVDRALATIHSLSVPAGIGGHIPEYHLAAVGQLAADFHMVSCYRCGSIHAAKGETFDPADFAPALAAMGQLPRPCIAFKLLGAGRFDPAVQIPAALRAIKPTDAILVGFYPKHQPRQVEDVVALVQRGVAVPGVEPS
ncbi:MAG TPA: hypothetical protein PLQ54_17320 [Armatimonadota bacterium]|nr:hypothetical protein [Armatimonadota bacterium]